MDLAETAIPASLEEHAQYHGVSARDFCIIFPRVSGLRLSGLIGTTQHHIGYEFWNRSVLQLRWRPGRA